MSAPEPPRVTGDNDGRWMREAMTAMTGTVVYALESPSDCGIALASIWDEQRIRTWADFATDLGISPYDWTLPD